MSKTCKNCYSNDCYICDKKGIKVKDEDFCNKWNEEQLSWKDKLMQRFLVVN